MQGQDREFSYFSSFQSFWNILISLWLTKFFVEKNCIDTLSPQLQSAPFCL